MPEKGGLNNVLFRAVQPALFTDVYGLVTNSKIVREIIELKNRKFNSSFLKVRKS